MAGDENIRNIGFEGRITAIQALAPQAIQDDTPVLSAAINTDSYPRARFLLVCEVKETTPTVHTIDFDISECATSGGEYAAGTTSGTITGASSDTTQIASYKRNPAKPYIKVTATGSHADVDVIAACSILAILPGT
jgi:hypothetical protein